MHLRQMFPKWPVTVTHLCIFFYLWQCDVLQWIYRRRCPSLKWAVFVRTSRCRCWRCWSCLIPSSFSTTSQRYSLTSELHSRRSFTLYVDYFVQTGSCINLLLNLLHSCYVQTPTFHCELIHNVLTSYQCSLLILCISNESSSLLFDFQQLPVCYYVISVLVYDFFGHPD